MSGVVFVRMVHLKNKSRLQVFSVHRVVNSEVKTLLLFVDAG